MRIFLDTANVDEIHQAAQWGIVSGVTTNPSLFAKETGVDFRTTIEEIASLIPGPISAEVTARDTENIIKQAREINAWAPNIAVKVPIDEAGIAAVSVLSKENVQVNCTLCFSLNQALLAAIAGAAFISPFVGRLDDAGHDGMALVADIVEVYQQYELPTQVIAASIRHPRHCIAAAKAGAHISTVPFQVLRQMFRHPLTDVGIERFLSDWAKLGGG
jgi:transaldolase